jgi:hypothetical protein
MLLEWVGGSRIFFWTLGAIQFVELLSLSINERFNMRRHLSIHSSTSLYLKKRTGDVGRYLISYSRRVTKSK